jgi:hypothetical protein
MRAKGAIVMKNKKMRNYIFNFVTDSYRSLKRSFFLLIMALQITGLAFSYTHTSIPVEHSRRYPMIEDAENHDRSQVLLRINNTGQFGISLTPPYDDYCIWPIGTYNNYIQGSGLWFGAKFDYDNNGDLDKVFVQGWNPLAGDSEFGPGRLGQDPEDPLARVYDSTDSTDLTEWPPEFEDPDSGDPMVYSVQDLVTIYNDVSGEPIFGESNIGIEVRQRSMAFTHDLSTNVIYVEWELTNVSEAIENGPFIFEDAWIGFDTYASVGIAWTDDLTSFFRDMVTPDGDTLVIDSAILWDSDFREPNFVGNPGLMGFALIQGPGNDADGIDNDKDGFIDESPFNGIDDDGDGDVDESDEVDELGLVNFSRHCKPTVPCEVLDPEFDSDGYDLLSCISEENPDSSSCYHCLEIDHPDHQRFMISSGPFDWLPSQTIHILFAFVFASPVGSIDQLELVGDPPRPDPNDPALADFIATVLEAREYARSGFTNVGIEDHDENSLPFLPKSFSLSQNYPNPFNPSTMIDITVPANVSGVTTLRIYNTRGRLVRTLIEEELGHGRHSFLWDGKDNRGEAVSSGIYFYTLRMGGELLTRKMTIMK